ncbi:MAG: FKBP-type peptidyl-prolyl cis-trans isomerase [Prevotella sp.]|nr:FKBP-type peptidyl-prolyl cis-trans isomerase [Prevotella sp.]
MNVYIYNKVKSVMRLLPLHLFVLLFLTVSCSETDDSVEEFANWQQTNETFYSSLCDEAMLYEQSGSTEWKVLKKWSLVDSLANTYNKFVVVKVLKSGSTDKGMPHFTDSVKVSYEGRLLPSANFPDGYVFDKSYYGDFDLATARPASFAVSNVVEGWQTVLQQMHPGDYWLVYVPYALGYGTSASGSIPAYSTLIYKMYLHSYW